MDFQIHRYPVSNSKLDLVIVANFAQDEADAFDDTSGAWDKVCVRSLTGWRAFLSDFTKNRVTFRQFIKPGILLENFYDGSWADSFQEKFTTKYVPEAYNNLLPIITDYRRKMHKEHERQRNDFMNASQPFLLSHQPSVSIIDHAQQYLPSPR